MNLYIHENNADVAIEVLKRFYVEEKDLYKLKVRWWRVSRARNKTLYCMNIIQNIQIPREVWRKDWHLHV